VAKYHVALNVLFPLCAFSRPSQEKSYVMHKKIMVAAKPFDPQKETKRKKKERKEKTDPHVVR
jgi:hypothetical protein